MIHLVPLAINCVCLQIEDKKDTKGDVMKDDKGNIIKVFKCQATIDTSAWEPASAIVESLCMMGDFTTCPRLLMFIEYSKAAKTLNVESAESKSK